MSAREDFEWFVEAHGGSWSVSYGRDGSVTVMADLPDGTCGCARSVLEPHRTILTQIATVERACAAVLAQLRAGLPQRPSARPSRTSASKSAT